MIVMLAISCSGSVGCLRSFGKFGGGLPSDSLVERRVHALYNTAALSIYAGCLGLIASGAFISSTLSIASGAIAIATLRGATVAGDIVNGRTVSVTHPTHSFQLAVGACMMRAISILEPRTSPLRPFQGPSLRPFSRSSSLLSSQGSCARAATMTHAPCS
jgi:hypothetical protein